MFAAMQIPQVIEGVLRSPGHFPWLLEGEVMWVVSLNSFLVPRVIVLTKGETR